MSLQESQQFDENRNNQKDNKNNQQIKNDEFAINSQINIDEIKINNDIIAQNDNKNNEQNDNNIKKYMIINNQKDDSQQIKEQDSNHQDINQNMYLNLKEQIELLEQQNPLNKIFQQEQMLDLLIGQQLNDIQSDCSLIQSLNGLKIDEYELQQHINCLEFTECQFCYKKFTLCQFQSHIYQEHEEYVCFNCGLIDKQITNQNHRLRCFQSVTFGFDDAKIQQLDSKENQYCLFPKQHKD